MYGYKRRYKRRVPYAVKQYVRAALDKNVEDKQATWDLQTQFGAITTTWVERSVAQPAQGVTQGYRVGTKIRLKSLEIDGVIASGVSETALDDPFNVVRIVIYSSDLATTPLATLGLGLNSVINNTTLSYMSKKYLDQYIPLTVTGTEKGQGDGYTPGLRKFKYFKRWKNGFPIEFQGDTATYPSKMLWVSMISDSATAPSPGFVCGYMKTRFEDA